jgi:hypothetical protein
MKHASSGDLFELFLCYVRWHPLDEHGEIICCHGVFVHLEQGAKRAGLQPYVQDVEYLDRFKVLEIAQVLPAHEQKQSDCDLKVTVQRTFRGKQWRVNRRSAV